MAETSKEFKSRLITTDSYVPLPGRVARREGAELRGTRSSEAQPFAERFDPFHEPYPTDPYPFLGEARAATLVFYSPDLEYWAVTRYHKKSRQALAEPMHAFGHDDPILTQEPPDLMAQHRPRLDEKLPGTMQRLNVLVRDAFDRHKAHVRPTDRLAGCAIGCPCNARCTAPWP
jgi:hypothetical protein